MFLNKQNDLLTKSLLNLLTRHLCPWDFPDKNTGVGCHFLLQGIFPTQGLNPHLLLGRQILYTEPPGKPSTWVYLLLFIY